MSDGCWAVVGWSDGLEVYSVFDDELSALRRMNEEGVGHKVIFLPWGMEPREAEKIV